MATLTNDEVKTLLQSHHTGMLLLMPGNEFACPADGGSVLRMQTFQFGMNGCPVCMMYSLRALMEREPSFKKLIIDALNLNINP